MTSCGQSIGTSVKTELENETAGPASAPVVAFGRSEGSVFRGILMMCGFGTWGLDS